MEYESTMDNILPQNEILGSSMEFFRSSNIASRVIVSMELTSSEKDLTDLLREADLLSASLDKNLFPDVTVGIAESSLAKNIAVMFEDLPEIISADELSEIDSWINQEHISRKLHDAYLQLLKPQGMLLGSMLRSDPLGLRLFVLEKLKSLSASTGYEVEIKDGHFVSRDRRHAMLIAKSSVAVTDSAGSQKLLGSLKQSLQRLPDYISADIISGHAHTVSNEKLIKKDIVLISIIAAAAMLLLYGLVIRDVSAVTIFMIPVAAIVFSINLSYLLLGKLSYWVIGLSSTIAGIATDYGTHVYFAARGKEDPAPYVKHIIKPVSFGALTTIAIFKASFANRLAEKLENRNLSGGLTVLLWFFLTLVLLYFSLHVEFEKDIKNIDGTEKEIINAEKRFHNTWGGGKTPAVLVINSKDYENALETNEKIYKDAVQAIGTENFTSMAVLLPSEITRKENSERWTKFWSAERKQKLKKLLAGEGIKYGFSDNAFDPFFANLKVKTGRNFKKEAADFGLTERFVQKTNDGYRMVSFFPDTEGYMDSMNEISRQYPNTYLVSATVLSSTLSKVVSSDLKLMTWISAISVIIMTYLCFFNIRETLIALVPPLTSIIWLFGIMALSGLSINAANMIAGVLVIGLNSDYGIFMTFRNSSEMNTGTIMAITLCTVTTLIGAGVLIFAKHPALSSVGITMVIGLAAGFFSSVMVVPKLCEFTLKSKKVKAV
ncbi:MAG: hypothetical protein HY759_02955 [Nitrospirae bacterium]|nr:hypothetical protein [Nitrospirota bacterium]